MPDILIRDVPEDVLAAVDAKARRVGLSRTEYLRRTLERERATSDASVTVDSLAELARRVRDLNDPDVVGDAWS